MTPEILIVGDPAGRRPLADAITAQGYEVGLCSPRDLNRIVRTQAPPSAIIACLGDLEPEVLLAGLRRTRAGASIPVILYGRLGGSVRDLADVLDIGADHFLEEPAGADELADALAQYAGPPRTPRHEHTYEYDPELGDELPRGRGGTERIPTRTSTATRPRAERGKALGELQRTLERLDASLRTDDPRSDPELAGLGLDNIPDVDPPLEEHLPEEDPLVTEIGEHLRGRGEGRTPVRGDDLTQPSVAPYSTQDRGRDHGRDRGRDRGGRRGRDEDERSPTRAPRRERSSHDFAVDQGFAGGTRRRDRDEPDWASDSDEGRSDDTRQWERPDSEGPLRRGREAAVSPIAARSTRAPAAAPAPTDDGGRGRASAVLRARRPDRDSRVSGRDADSEREAARERLRALVRPGEADFHHRSSRYDPHARGTPWPTDDFDPSESTFVRRERGDATTRRRSLGSPGRPTREPVREPAREPVREREPVRDLDADDAWASDLEVPELPEWNSSARAREPEPEPAPPSSAPHSAPSRGRRTTRRAPGGTLRVDPSLREAGKLGPDLDVPTLLWALHEQRFTGRLRLTRQRIEKQIWLHDGEAVFARSTATSDRLVDGLLRRGVLTRPQYETARRLAAKEPRRAGELLVDAGFLKASELDVLLRDHLARVIDSTFVWADGAWATEPGERTDEPIQLETPIGALILDGARYRCDASELEDRLTRRAGPSGPLVPRLRPPEDMDDDFGRGRAAAVAALIAELGDRFRLLPEEASWLRRFDGRHGVAALLADGADEQALFALLFTLDLAGLVDLREQPEQVVSDERDPSQVDRERILERLRLAREADYFELLGVARDAARSEIRQAHAELSATFADDALDDASLRRHLRELRELRVALDEAHDILADDAMRSAYLAHLGDD